MGFFVLSAIRSGSATRPDRIARATCKVNRPGKCLCAAPAEQRSPGATNRCRGDAGSHRARQIVPRLRLPIRPGAPGIFRREPLGLLSLQPLRSYRRPRASRHISVLSTPCRLGRRSTLDATVRPRLVPAWAFTDTRTNAAIRMNLHMSCSPCHNVSGLMDEGD
jgi:hypothetical protein